MEPVRILRNKKPYYRSQLRLFLLLLFGHLFLGIWDVRSLLVLPVLFMVLMLLLLDNKFTQEVVIDNGRVEIVYYRFMRKHTTSFTTEALQIILKKEVVFKGGAYRSLSFAKRGKVMYCVDSRDGFDEAEMEQFAEGFTKATSPAYHS